MTVVPGEGTGSGPRSQAIPEYSPIVWLGAELFEFLQPTSLASAWVTRSALCLGQCYANKTKGFQTLTSTGWGLLS